MLEFVEHDAFRADGDHGRHRSNRRGVFPSRGDDDPIGVTPNVTVATTVLVAVWLWHQAGSGMSTESSLPGDKRTTYAQCEFFAF
jgi:hypothetical protein